MQTHKRCTFDRDRPRKSSVAPANEADTARCGTGLDAATAASAPTAGVLNGDNRTLTERGATVRSGVDGSGSGDPVRPVRKDTTSSSAWADDSFLPDTQYQRQHDQPLGPYEQASMQPIAGSSYGSTTAQTLAGAMSTQAPAAAYTIQSEGAGHGPTSTGAGPSRSFNLNFLMSSPVTPVPQASLAPSALIDLVRRGQQTLPAATIDTFTGQALDDEAADDEELYLVGTAVERDALVLHRLASESNHTLHHSSTTGSTGTTANIRTRAVSPTVSFVFYKSTPYDFEGSRGAGVYSQVKGLMDDRQAKDVLDR